MKTISRKALVHAIMTVKQTKLGLVVVLKYHEGMVGNKCVGHFV